MGRLFWIAAGGAAGTLARYGITAWATSRFGAGMPLGTLIVNLAGCFAIALIMYVAAAWTWPDTLRFALTVGVLGGFTTYSSFNYETTRLLVAGDALGAGLNAFLTLAGGFACGWLGLLCGRAIVGR